MSIDEAFEGWEVVTDVGGGRWLGLAKTDGYDGEDLVLEPAYELSPRTSQCVVQNGQPGILALQVLTPWCVLDDAATLRVHIRWASRIRAASLSAATRKHFASSIRAFERSSKLSSELML